MAQLHRTVTMWHSHTGWGPYSTAASLRVVWPEEMVCLYGRVTQDRDHTDTYNRDCRAPLQSTGTVCHSYVGWGSYSTDK